MMFVALSKSGLVPPTIVPVVSDASLYVFSLPSAPMVNLLIPAVANEISFAADWYIPVSVSPLKLIAGRLPVIWGSF